MFIGCVELFYQPQGPKAVNYNLEAENLQERGLAQH
jgi:hypothetical protein